MPDPTPPSPSKQHVFQAPTGTRDLYPVEAARRRFIMDAWRKVSINHGFEEIDGPTFEHLDLYTVKSGEGIVSELFSFERAGGEKTYALRPEFTPTLARMYAAKASALPKPTKWFTAGPFFRAERPQRGRLREFLQWNCDYIGAETPEARIEGDVEVIACCVDLLRILGLSAADVRVALNDRACIEALLLYADVPESRIPEWFTLLDRVEKINNAEFLGMAAQLGSGPKQATAIRETIQNRFAPESLTRPQDLFDRLLHSSDSATEPSAQQKAILQSKILPSMARLLATWHKLGDIGLKDWIEVDFRVARGLAYYTGTVFEVIVDNERAVAGGGRYDNLIEMFGGPPTPAVGFGMGDVVLSLVLQDKGLMPSDAELMGIAGQWPDAFVISNGTPEADAAIPGVLAALRRGMSVQEREERKLGSESRPTSAPDYGLHARRSYKSTKNVGKLMQDAAKCGARFAVIIESGTEATIKNMRTNVQDQHRTPLADLPAELRKRL